MIYIKAYQSKKDPEAYWFGFYQKNSEGKFNAIMIDPDSIKKLDKENLIKNIGKAFIVRNENEIKIMKESEKLYRRDLTSNEVKTPYNRDVAGKEAVELCNKIIKDEKAYVDRNTYKLLVEQIKLQPNVLKEGKMNIYSLINAYKELNRLGLIDATQRKNFTIFPYCIDTSKPENKREYVAQILIKPMVYINASANLISTEVKTNDNVLMRGKEGNIYDIDSITCKAKLDFEKDGQKFSDSREETYSTEFICRTNKSVYSDAYKETLDLVENKELASKLKTTLTNVDENDKAIKTAKKFKKEEPALYVPSEEEKANFSKQLVASTNDIVNNSALRRQILYTDAIKFFIKNRRKDTKQLGLKDLETFKNKVNASCSSPSYLGMERLQELLDLDRGVIKLSCDHKLPLGQRIVYIDNRMKDNTYRQRVNFSGKLSIPLFDEKGKAKSFHKEDDLLIR